MNQTLTTHHKKLARPSSFTVDDTLSFSDVTALRKLKQNAGSASDNMVASYDDTITRLENILRELECEFLYLINDIQFSPNHVELPPDVPVRRLEVARACLSAAAKALSREEPAELVH